MRMMGEAVYFATLLGTFKQTDWTDPVLTVVDFSYLTDSSCGVKIVAKYSYVRDSKLGLAIIETQIIVKSNLWT